jgi:hypothetical protein
MQFEPGEGQALLFNCHVKSPFGELSHLDQLIRFWVG